MPFIHFQEDNKSVEIKKSKIPGANQGLFSQKLIKKGDFICFYTGVFVSKDSVENGYYTSDYLYQHTGAKYIIDAQDPNSCYGRYANDSLSLRKNNAEFDMENGKDYAYLRATKNIKKGEEIFVAYGYEFWKDVNTISQEDIDFVNNSYQDEQDEDEQEIRIKKKAKVKSNIKTKVKSNVKTNVVIDISSDNDEEVKPKVKTKRRKGVVPILPSNKYAKNENI